MEQKLQAKSRPEVSNAERPGPVSPPGEELRKSLERGKGLDVGTAFIYASEKIGKEIVFKIERDAFSDSPHSDHLQALLEREKVNYVRRDNQLYVIGNSALRFAKLFGRPIRRPLERGVISPLEKDALPIIQIMIENAIGPCRSGAETVYYGTPAQPIDADFDVLYHQHIVSGFLADLGYNPKPINEGLAVIFSELAHKNFTGLALSFGGGMVNACLANYSVPVLTFSMARGGDWIDKQVSRVVNEPISTVTSWKESFLDLQKRANLSRMEQALSIYYDILLDYVVKQLAEKLGEAALYIEEPLTVIVSGGTAKPNGFLNRFQEALGRFKWSFELGELRLAVQPLHSVTKGALIAAIADEIKMQETGVPSLK